MADNLPSPELAGLLHELCTIVNKFSIAGDGISGNLRTGFIVADISGQETEVPEGPETPEVSEG